MTEHAHEDTLLQLVLGLLDADSDTAVRDHLDSCPECRTLFEDLQGTVSLVAGVRPDVGAPVPVFHRPSRYAWLRVAALLVIAFGAGYGVSESLRPTPIVMIRQQVVPSPPAVTDTGYVACEGVDISLIRR